MLVSLLVFLVLPTAKAQSCSMVNWWSSFDKKGYSTCSFQSTYMNGLYRNDYGSDKIYRLEEVKCCGRTPPYYNQPTQCMAADWVHSLDNNHRWSTCPTGHFLQGLYRSDGNNLHNIEYGKCCKPANHPYWWGDCYDHDIKISFDSKGVSKCNAEYYMTGLYRGGCDGLSCIEKIKCCKMYPNPPTLTSLSDVKTRVMDVTMKHFALLAHYLGYGWCSGCRAEWVGEDFRRSGDSWHASKAGSCEGYKSDQRLKLNYGDFKFSIKDIKYGDPVIQSLQPTVYDSGRVVNDDVSSLVHKIEREIRSVRTVSHTTTSSWKYSHELGIEISYSPPGATGGVGGKVNYKFNYEKSSTTSDSTSNQQYNSIKILSQKTLNPNSAATYKIMLTKTRSTVPYTATVIAHFSGEMDGFLRWGGGYGGDSTNYHYQHRGSGDRPTFKYRFGSASKPFYTALKEESDRSMRPWQWTDMKNRYTSAQSIINTLVDEKLYEFTLTGKFEDVIGQHAEVQWKSESLSGKKRSLFGGKMPLTQEDFPESLSDEDPPEIFPAPPVVTIKPVIFKEDAVKHEKPLG
ncbi:uncharacterized protein LOC114518245 [Dendronephthya gigantea]|uniref:uncharacterized protein LOC114518245 n=1 Tax=Dendronephthya gigantea TaxID=151771 RepID=UPI00106CBD52|nr:uncharacterized protein LOC114518245 [Dendronephthya gigantea]